MAYVALLDADVLHPYLSVDLLLRLAERRMFRPAWSEEILAEVRDSLIRRGIDPQKVDRRLHAMREAFPEAMTSQIGRFASAVPASVDRGDRHVVAAALAARAEAIATRNVSDFAPADLFELGIEVQSLDAFLVNQWTLDPEVVRDAFREMGEDRTRPPRTVVEVLDALAPLAPGFVESVRASTPPLRLGGVEADPFEAPASPSCWAFGWNRQAAGSTRRVPESTRTTRCGALGAVSTPRGSADPVRAELKVATRSSRPLRRGASVVRMRLVVTWSLKAARG